MLCTEDLKIIKVLKQSTPQRVEVECPVTQDVIDYLTLSDELGISTRSRYARLGTYFQVGAEDQPYIYDQRSFVTELSYVSFGPEITFAAGDGTVRVYGLRKKERASVEQLRSIVHEKNIPGRVSDNNEYSNALEIEMEGLIVEPTLTRSITAKELEQMEDISGLLSTRLRTSWSHLSETTTLLLTKPLELPDDHYGLIRGTTWFGSTEHRNSTVIDPGFSGSIVAEVNTRRSPSTLSEAPRLLIELYQVTPLRNPSN